MEIFKTESTQEHTIRDFFVVIFKHHKKVILLFLAIFLVVMGNTFLATDIYQTEAKLFVRLGSETLNQESVGGQRIMISQSMETQLNSVIQMLQSREIAVNLYKRMGKDAFDPDKEPYAENHNPLIRQIKSGISAVMSFPKNTIALLTGSSEPADEAAIQRQETEIAVKNILESLSAELVPDSNIIVLRYEDVYPERAHEALENLIDLYLSRHIELNNSPGSFEFFKEQSVSLKNQLEEAETELKEAKNKIGVSSLEQHRSILSEQIGALQQKLEETESGIVSSQAKISSLETKLAQLPENLVVSETIGAAMSAGEDLRRRLYELKLREQELLSTFKPESIPVSEIRRQIEEAEALLGKSTESRQVTSGVNPMHQELKISLMLENGTLEALRAQQTAIKKQLQNANKKLREINTAEVRLAKLRRQKALLENNYRRYASSLEQVRIDKAREMEKLSNISIAQAPVVPIEPVRPNKKVNLALGLFLALFGGLGLAFFLEYMDDTFRKPEEVEDVLKLPVLGSIEKLTDDKL